MGNMEQLIDEIDLVPTQLSQEIIPSASSIQNATSLFFENITHKIETQGNNIVAHEKPQISKQPHHKRQHIDSLYEDIDGDNIDDLLIQGGDITKQEIVDANQQIKTRLNSRSHKITHEKLTNKIQKGGDFLESANESMNHGPSDSFQQAIDIGSLSSTKETMINGSLGEAKSHGNDIRDLYSFESPKGGNIQFKLSGFSNNLELIQNFHPTFISKSDASIRYFFFRYFGT